MTVGATRVGRPACLYLSPWRIHFTVRPEIPRIAPRIVLARAVRAALEAAAAPAPASVGLILSDDAELTQLNAQAMGRDEPTDVLSFPLLPPSAFPPHAGQDRDVPGTSGSSANNASTAASASSAADGGAPRPGSAAGDRAGALPGASPFVLPPRQRPHLGDIVVSVERAAAQASEGRGGQTGDVRWSPADELRLLVTHGALHLCGWDHERPEEEAAMRELERKLLAQG